MQDDPYLRWLISLELDISRVNRLLGHFGTARAIFAYAHKRDARIEQKIAESANRRHLEQANSPGDFEFISKDNPKFPDRLKKIPDSPAGIFVRGEIPKDFAKTPAVAIIGSRDNSLYGRQVTQKLARDLAKVGIIVISGMARGLDARAHNAAIEAGGQTLAILPSGIDICYPVENSGLYRQIPAHGALITEFPPGFRPRPWSFPARNRIISAMADILIVTEAGKKSGTFTTVNHALSQGKEVLSVPGGILSPQSVGTNTLIKEGAGIITTYLDALVAIKNQSHLKEFFMPENRAITAYFADTTMEAKKLPLANDETLVYSCINYEPISIEFIVNKTGLGIAAINKILLEMELNGRIKKLPGNKFIRN
ncbi:MAG: DNA-processing protein DprA [Clostridiales bacterium]|nr:DNA-processing protein DprA [Clostridiales bacterium]